MESKDKKMDVPLFALTFVLLFMPSGHAFPRQEKPQAYYISDQNYSGNQAYEPESPVASSAESADTPEDQRTSNEEQMHAYSDVNTMFHGEDNKNLQPPHVRSNDKSLEHKETIQKSSSASKRDDTPDESANKRSPAIIAVAAKALMKNPKIQEAVINKGLEVAGKLVDKQLRIIDEAQEKAAAFLKKEIKLDIEPDKGWANEDMFVPPGYHIDAAVEEDEESPEEKPEMPFVFPSGIGSAMMNGCYGKDYAPNDPCHNSKTTSSICTDQIDGAAFLGVGFDGRGKYSPESRKMSIVQRNCVNKGSYDGLDVPDTMNVHGIYDTSASLATFESRAEYRKFLQEEAGVSGSYFGFSAGVKEAWGESTQSTKSKYMAVMDVDVDRYEIYMDEVKPKDLTMAFLKEYLSLPTSYFSAGGPLKYQDFLQRWGTHYIKSAKFGGQLEIRKTMDAEDAGTKKDFEVQMEAEYKTLFASVGAKASAQEGESKRKQTKTTSTSVVAQGGSQEIASILSDVYSPTFKTEFKDWLKTIPTYPKAFRFHMGAITDLLNFRANDLFPDEKVDWGCEGNAGDMLTEEKDGKIVKYYTYEVTEDGSRTTKKQYCEFDSRQALEDAIQMRRTSLLRAVEIYMEEGPASISNMDLPVCPVPTTRPTVKDNDLSATSNLLSWKLITKPNSVFRVSFDILNDLPSSLRTALDIRRNASRLLRLEGKKWHTSDQDGNFHLYGTFNNGDSKDLSKHKVSIMGLVLTFNEADGGLVLSPQDYKASKKFFPTLKKEMAGMELARIEMPHKDPPPARPPGPGKTPCKVDWSNTLRLDPTDSKGKCLHFTASTEGSIFVVFAALPKDKATWYYVEISPTRVATYKGTTLKTHTFDVNARALADASLYQSYFVCITESEKSRLIEYGKSLGTADSGDIYLNMVDSTSPLNVRFYAFGNGNKPAKIMDAHLVARQLTKADCKGDTVRDSETKQCVQKCHKDCDPLAGCLAQDNPKVGEGCYACRVAMDVTSKNCLAVCPKDNSLTTDKRCVPTFDVLIKEGMTVSEMTLGNVPTMKEITICMWLKLEGAWGASDEDVTLIHYDRPGYCGVDSFMVKLYGDRTQRDPDFRFQVENSANYRLQVSQLTDQRWHQMCVTWSGYTGVNMYYRDGVRIQTKTYSSGVLNGGGTLRLGGSRRPGTIIHMTELNIWDRVLYSSEIAETASKCDAGKGNIKQWHEWYDVASTKTTYFSLNSKCRA